MSSRAQGSSPPRTGRRCGSGVPDELTRILLLEERGYDAFVARFQQTTPPVHAKGVEDTAFYRWNRCAALNEVGGRPGALLALGGGVPRRAT